MERGLAGRRQARQRARKPFPGSARRKLHHRNAAIRRDPADQRIDMRRHSRAAIHDVATE